MAATDHRPRNNKEIILTEKTEEILLGKQKRYCWENRDDKEKTEASPRCGVVTSLFFCGTARVMNFSALRPARKGRVRKPAGPPLPYCCGTASAMYCNIPDMNRMGCRLQSAGSRLHGLQVTVSSQQASWAAGYNQQSAGFMGCRLQQQAAGFVGCRLQSAVSRLHGLQLGQPGDFVFIVVYHAVYIGPVSHDDQHCKDDLDDFDDHGFRLQTDIQGDYYCGDHA